MQRHTAWQRAIETGRSWSEAEAEAALDAQANSGESVAAFARRHRIVPRRLYWWRYRLAAAEGEKRKAGAGTVGRLIPLTVVEPLAMARPRAEGRVVVIDGGLRVEIEEPEAVSPAWIATLLRTVREGA